MKQRILLTVVVVSWLLASSLGLSAEAQSGAGEIKIGIVAPLTGSMSTTGADMWQAAVLAAEEINAKGGVNVNGIPMQIKLVQGDDGSSGETGVKAVTKLITEDEVDILVGGFSSGITKADSVVAAEHQVPFVITGASSPDLTRRTDIDTTYFFHFIPTTSDYSESILLFVDEIIKPKIDERFNFPENRPLRVGVLYQDSAYGIGVYDGIKRVIAEYNLNMEIVAAEKFKMSETDYRTTLTVIKAANPDIIFPAAVLNEQALIVPQGRRDVGLNTIYLSVICNDDTDYYTGVERWGEYSVQDSIFGPYSVPAGPIYNAVTNFKQNYENKWHDSPSMMGATTYEGVYIAAEAIKNAGTLDKDKIRDALDELEMPQDLFAMKDGVIAFSPDYRESKFEPYLQQLIWDQSVGETRPKIIWPTSVKETDFVLPDWYEPGSAPTPTETPTGSTTPTPKAPGFGAVVALAGLLAVTYLVRRRAE
jgi:branched-chain amino acid transport system substrate-binding protein